MLHFTTLNVAIFIMVQLHIKLLIYSQGIILAPGETFSTNEEGKYDFHGNFEGALMAVRTQAPEKRQEVQVQSSWP